MTMRSEVSPMQIEVLYFEDCPNHLPTVERINAVLREEGDRSIGMPCFLPSRCAVYLFGPLPGQSA
jgi:hypothetical protein